MNSTGDASKDYQLNKTIEELQADGSIVLSGNDVKSAQAQTTENQLTKNKQNVVSLTFTKDGTTKLQMQQQKHWQQARALVSIMTEHL